jgi:hypothetical protein
MILKRIGLGKYRLDIGLPWGYLDYIDIEDPHIEDSPYGKNYYTNLMFENLYPVDIIPVFPRISKDLFRKIKNSQNLSKEEKEQVSHILNFLYEPDYEKGVKHYNDLLSLYSIIPRGKTVSYIRLYATDNTQLSESIVSNYETVPVKEFIDSLKERFGGGIVGSLVGTMRRFSQSAYLTPDDINRFTENLNNKGYLPAIIQAAAAGVQGFKIDFPKVWDSTNYNRTLNINISFSCPYGHPEVLYQWIFAPLIAIVLLGSPINIYGFTGVPLYVRVKAYGQFDVKLGAIQSITINRGGQNTVYNMYKQPLKLEVTMTVIDLYSQFSAEYTQFKNNPIDAQDILTSPISSEDDPFSDESINPSSQPTVSSLINSLRPVTDANISSPIQYIKDKNINKPLFSFTRRKKNKNSGG